MIRMPMPEAAFKTLFTIQKGPANLEDLEGPFCMVSTLDVKGSCRSATYKTGLFFMFPGVRQCTFQPKFDIIIRMEESEEKRK